MNLWAAARVDLALSDMEFLRCTLRQFDLLMRRRRARDERADLRAGIIASTIANFAGKTLADGRGTSPLDFLPWLPQPRLTGDQQDLFLAGLGEVVA